MHYADFLWIEYFMILLRKTEIKTLLEMMIWEIARLKVELAEARVRRDGIVGRRVPIEQKVQSHIKVKV